MLISGCQTAFPGILCLLTWHLSLLEVNCGLLMRKCSNGEGSLHAFEKSGASLSRSATGLPNFEFELKLLVFLYVSGCIPSASTRLQVKSSPFSMCSGGLASCTILHFVDPCFAQIHTTWTTHRDRNWWMQDSPSCVLSRVIVPRHSEDKD